MTAAATKEPSAMTDAEFIAYVAQIKPTDLLPEEYTRRGLYRSRADFSPLIHRLVGLGVMSEPPLGTDMGDVLELAVEAANLKLASNPMPSTAPSDLIAERV